MSRIFFVKIAKQLTIFSVLTIVTQIGGLVYLISFIFWKNIDKRVHNKWVGRSMNTLSFIMLYCLTTFFVVPIIAKPLGRVPLPLIVSHHLRPLTIWTCIFNRNYVRPELRDLTYEVAKELSEKYPGTLTNYLDANFPFFDKFPLIPHLSHNDGKKLDLSFCYNDSKTGLPTNQAPSFIGYGICEEPTTNEANTIEYCGKKGYYQYSFLKNILPQRNKINFKFNERKTKELVELFASKPAMGRIFIEPHLKARLKLTSEKIRFQGCRAVRHDDHLHVQIR